MTRTSFALVDNDGEEELFREAQEGFVELKAEMEFAASQRGGREEFHLMQEAGRLFHIAIPSVAIQFSMLFIFPQAASAIGTRLGTNALGGFSLGSLVGNLTCLSIMVGALSASDILMPRAFGAKDYDELGRLAIRSMVVCILLLSFPLVPLCTMMDRVLVTLGQDLVASQLASDWIRIYLLGAPANLGFRVIQRFLVAQQQPWPPVYASVFPAVVLNPILLRLLIPIMGCSGSALAIALTQWSMLILLLIYLYFKPVYHPETWPGLKMSYIREALMPVPFLQFLNLSIGGVVSLSEWWFWEIGCFIAGSFGVVALCAHTIAYNLIPLLFMIPLGICTGLTVRIGNVIVYDPDRAKLLAYWTFFLTAGIGAVVSFALHFFQLPIIHLFTHDEQVVHLTQAIWAKNCYYVFILYIFGINGAILRALGMQWQMAAIVFVTLWVFTLPAIFWFAVHDGGGLIAQWTILPVFYTLMQGALMLSYVTVDWSQRSKDIGEAMHLSRIQSRGQLSTETTELLPKDHV